MPLGSGATLVWTVSGAMLGLLLAVVIAFLRDAVGPRVGTRNRARSVAGVWVLARIMRDLDRKAGRSGDADAGSRQIVGAVDVLASVGVALVVGVDEDAETEHAVVRLNRTLINIPREGWPDDRVALLAGPRTRLRHIVQARKRLELRGASVYGLILRGQRGGRFSRLWPRRSRTVATPGAAPAMQRN